MAENGEDAAAAVHNIQVAGPAVQAIRVVTKTRNLRTQPFIIPDEMNAVGKAWQEWLEGIEREFRFFKISEAVDKKDAMIIYGGNGIARLEKSLPDPETGDVYTKLRTKLNSHFTQKKNKHHARYLFLKMRPHVGETISAYAARLREKAKECEFGDTFDERILEHVIQTIDNKKIIERAISKTWDITRFLTEASQTEDIVRQIQDMGTERVDHAGRVQSVPAINRFKKQKAGKGKVKRRIKKRTEAGESTSSDDEFFGQAAEHLSQAQKVRQIGGVGTTSRCVKVKLNDVDVQMEEQLQRIAPEVPRSFTNKLDGHHGK